MKPVIIYGLGDFSKQLHYYLSIDAKREVVAFTVDSDFYQSDFFLDLPVIKFDEITKYFNPNSYDMIVAIGYKKMRNRQVMFNKAKEKGYTLINFIHSSVIGATDTIIGENNILLSNVILEPFVTLGDNNIVWSNNIICHDSIVGNHNFIAASSILGGFSKIRNNTFVGFRSTIIENIVLAEENLIASNTLILKNTQPFTKYKGTPGKEYGENHEENGIEL